jgi:hypothetical protein
MSMSVHECISNASKRATGEQIAGPAKSYKVGGIFIPGLHFAKLVTLPAHAQFASPADPTDNQYPADNKECKYSSFRKRQAVSEEMGSTLSFLVLAVVLVVLQQDVKGFANTQRYQCSTLQNVRAMNDFPGRGGTRRWLAEDREKKPSTASRAMKTGSKTYAAWKAADDEYDEDDDDWYNDEDDDIPPNRRQRVRKREREEEFEFNDDEEDYDDDEGYDDYDDNETRPSAGAQITDQFKKVYDTIFFFGVDSVVPKDAKAKRPQKAKKLGKSLFFTKAEMMAQQYINDAPSETDSKKGADTEKRERFSFEEDDGSDNESYGNAFGVQPKGGQSRQQRGRGRDGYARNSRSSSDDISISSMSVGELETYLDELSEQLEILDVSIGVEEAGNTKRSAEDSRAYSIRLQKQRSVLSEKIERVQIRYVTALAENQRK